MSLRLRACISIWLLCSTLIGLGFALGHNLPNNKIAFSADCGADREVYVYDWSRWLTVNLSKNPGSSDSMPSWSSDGQQIAFQTDRDGNSEIYVADLNSASIHNLTHRRNFDVLPIWSPNGRHIAFLTTTDANSPAIAVMDVVADTIREFSVAVLPSFSPVWSPDGRHISFMEFGGGAPEIFTLDLVMEEIQNVSNHTGAVDSYPAWSPDGKHLTFTSNRSGISQIYMIDVEKDFVTLLIANTEMNYVESAWSPDAQHIATIVEGSRIHIINIEGDISRIFDLQQIPGSLLSVNWSPAGDYLIVGAGDDSRSANYIVNSASGTIYNISSPTCSYEPATWSP